jgi:Leucine-rich repeat (LRR) protein
MSITSGTHTAYTPSQNTNPSLSVRTIYQNFVRKLRQKTWENDPKITPAERTNRALAAEKIQRCYALRTSELDRSNLTLTTLPDLSHLTQLQKLDLSHNQLTSVTLPNFPALSDLNLGYNQLTSVTLPNLPRLSHLNLQHNCNKIYNRAQLN